VSTTVGIVGLGFAGLRAAMLLEAAGAEVQLFEAKSRPGGRCYTVDEGGGVLYEAGGEWIDADHHRMIALLNSFGLGPDVRGAWPRRLRFRGKMTSEEQIWSDALEDDLRVEAAARELCQGLKLPPWSNDQAAELDLQSLAQFVDQFTESERGKWWVTSKYRSDEGDDLESVGLLGWLSGYLHYLDREGDELSAYRLPGGASTLCDRMLASIRGPANFGAILQRVRQDASGVSLVFDRGAARVDHLIITLPPSALEHVVFEPALSVGKRCAVEACRMSRAIKICWEFDRPWWKDAGWGGSLHCDGALQQTWDGSLGEAPVLTAYICGQQAAEWTQLGDPVRAGVYELAQMFPEAATHFRRGWVHDWINDPYSRGAFSHLAPGYVLEHMRDIAPPEGRIHFAGEHTATWVGFIEGALESAERVTAEVLAK
jgi:monoamine oxidase